MERVLAEDHERDGSTWTESGSVPLPWRKRVKGGLSNRTEKRLYIEGDARIPYANVVKVPDAVRTAGVEAPNLLTAQQDSSEPGTPRTLGVHFVPTSKITLTPGGTASVHNWYL